ncbi:MAG: hypothetical protein AAGA60_14600 [Cyanobacteria bacterium P01_E01_bin.42]
MDRTVNERSLSTLLRALLLSQGQFALILVRCNYQGLREEIWQKFQEAVFLRSPDLAPLKALHLNPSISTLLAPLLEALEADPEQNAPTPSLEVPDAPDAPPAPKSPSALVIFGLELVKDPDLLFKAANQIRDEFRKHLSLPTIFWVTDDLLQKLTRLAPDFRSWAAASIKFELPLAESATLVWQTTENVFQQLLEAGAEKFVPNKALDLAPKCRARRELEFARSELLSSSKRLNSASEATWQFILGRDAYQQNRLEQALKYFQKSLDFWCRGTGYWSMGNWLLMEEQWGEDSLSLESSASRGALVLPRQLHVTNPFLEQKGVTLFHLGLCYRLTAQRNPASAEEAWQEAKTCFGASLEIFTIKEKPDFAAGLIVQLGIVLQQLEEWNALKGLGRYALNCFDDRQSQTLHPHAYGFLARTALEGGEWEEAERLARKALDCLSQIPYPLPQQHASYLLLLARVKHGRGERQLALEPLQNARQILLDRWSLADNRDFPLQKERLYLEILTELRALYWEERQYKQAFALKQEGQFVEHYCGLRAFHGLYPLADPDPAAAGGGLWANVVDRRSQAAIAASGRQAIVEELLETLSLRDRKLTILHGASGVGKSSLLRGCLLATLRVKPIAARNALPILQTQYRYWERELCRLFEEAIAPLSPLRTEKREGDLAPLEEPWQILQQLRDRWSDRVFTLFIFDRFEEFFFLCPQIERRQKFYEFLRELLSISFVKVILSIREDYLHHLLEIENCVDLATIDNNLLDRGNRYYLQDLTPSETRSAIVHLTENSHFHLEPALIDAFVGDLSRERGRVRPIELHLVGSQLQSDRIETLQDYLALGENPKTVLVTRSLLEIVADCGRENQDMVWRILFALTAENGTRPLKTKSELLSVISYQLSVISSPLLLNSILEILVNSRLVFRFPEDPEDRYQLARDYFVSPIREEAQAHFTRAIEASLEYQQWELARERQKRWKASFVGVAMTVLALLSGYWAWHARQQQHVAQQELVKANLLAESAASESLYVSGRKFDSLLAALRSGHQLLEMGRSPLTPLNKGGKEEPTFRQDSVQAINNNLPSKPQTPPKRGSASGGEQQTTNSGATPRRRKTQGNAHQDNKQQTTTHPPTPSQEGELSTTNNQQLFPLEAGENIDAIAQFKIISALERALHGTKERNRLSGHKEAIWDLAFSADGTLLASASSDRAVKLWCEDGTLLATLDSHEDSATSVDLYQTPQGIRMASSSWDGTVRVWEFAEMPCHSPPRADFVIPEPLVFRPSPAAEDVIYNVRFSPDGRTLATAGKDGAIRLQTLTGDAIAALSARSGSVQWVEFSPKGNFLAAAGNDGGIQLWSVEGVLLNVFRGHEGGVTYVAFSPDGETIASASRDGTVKLWDLNGNLRRTLAADREGVLSVRFSPDGEEIASAGHDGTIKVWDRQGNLLETLASHRDGVTGARFHPKNHFLASASFDKTIKLWNLDGNPRLVLREEGSGIRDVAISPDGELVVTAGENGTIGIWTRSGERLLGIPAYTEAIESLSFSPDGTLFASGGWDGIVKIWNRRGILQATLQGHGERVADLAWSPDSRVLVSGSWDGMVKIWNRQGELQETLQRHRQRVHAVAFSPEDNILVTGGEEGMYWWQSDEWGRFSELALLPVLDSGNWIMDLHFLPSGNGLAGDDRFVLAAGGYDNAISFWGDRDRLLGRLKGYTDSIRRFAVDPTGEILATISWDNDVELWHANDTLLTAWEAHEGEVVGVSWSADGGTIATAGKDGTVRIRSLDLHALVAKSCHWLGDYLRHSAMVQESDRALCEE